MTVCYVENDKFAAAWLRNLVASGAIAPGVVDERDLRDIRPEELDRFAQVHLCAGIGIWSLALREAGVADDRRIWTASFPCQPFSAAGQRAGFTDERHLWPAGFHLIDQCRPPIILGEQVASPDGLRWLDLVSADMEGAGYAFGAADLCAAGACVDFDQSEEGRATVEWIRRTVDDCPDPELAAELRDFAASAGGEIGYGPAHIRQRLYWMANAQDQQHDGRGNARGGRGESADGGASERLAHADDARSQGRIERGDCADQRLVGSRGLVGADWIVCTDGKARPTQPGVLPLADAGSFRNRMGALRGAGNALHFETAVRFVEAANGVGKFFGLNV